MTEIECLTLPEALSMTRRLALQEGSAPGPSLWPVDSCLHLGFLHIIFFSVCLCIHISLFNKFINHIGLGPTLKYLTSLDYLCTDYLQMRSCSEVLEVRIPTHLFLGGGIIEP